MTITSPAKGTSLRRRPGRWEATGYAYAHVAMFGPSLALFIVVTVAIPLTLITVGAVMLVAVVPIIAAFAELNRRMAAHYLGEPVPAVYRSTQGLGPLAILRVWMKDPARWRDYLWLLVNSTAGFVLAILAAVPILAVAWYAVYPLVFAVTPAGVFDMDLGFMTMDTIEESFLAWIPGVIFALLWWWATPALMRAKALLDRSLLSRGRTEQLERRVQQLADTRAESVDFSAAELRRIERDLHDGAQARLVALGMSLGMADEMMERDPESARRLLAEARTTSSAALGDLRSVVRGIHPPVLADRGLSGAVQALALDMPLSVTVVVTLSGRPPAPIESAVYFAVAECLANIGKHSRATHAWVHMSHSGGLLQVEVGDDGVGGARTDAGTGMLGVMRRLAAFDGTMKLASPLGGPTLITMEVPCALSSPRTTPSSATD